MRFYQALALASVAAALPLEVATRQLDRTSLTENEFSRSLTCGKVIFVWARGSTEAGNMVCADHRSQLYIATFLIKEKGSVIGQPLGDELRKEYGRDLQIEGVEYAALVSTNYLPGGTSLAAELEMRGVLEDIHDRCPNAIILAGGYS